MLRKEAIDNGWGTLTGRKMAKKRSYFMLGILVLLGLYASSLYNYLLFHSIAEIFSVVIAGAIFVIAWNTRQFLANNFLLFLGIAYLYVGGLDLLHTLSYKGIAIFQGYGADLPTQLWISARFVESLSILAAFLFLNRSLKAAPIFVVYTIVCILLTLCIFYWRVFPVCFVEGEGLTPFKKFSEYGISFILLSAVALLFTHRDKFDDNVFGWIISSMGFTILSELAFTTYTDPYGVTNLLGHFFKILSFWCIYKALIETGLKKPYALFFKELKQSEEQYRSLFTHMINGFARHKVLFDGHGKPVDYKFLEINRAFEKLTGLKQKDIIGKRVTEVLPGIEKDPFDWIAKYGRVAKTGEPARLETYSDLLKRWYSIIAYSPEKDYFVTVFEDITQRKRTDEALRRAREDLEVRVRERTAELSHAKELLQTIIDHIPVMLCLFDPKGEIRVLNTHFGNLMGFTFHEAEKINLKTECYPDPVICNEIWSHMKRGEPGWRDFTITTKNGGKLETSWANVTLSEGSLIGIGIDITDRKRAEEKNRIYLTQLERSNRELQDFAFAASHDLQEPLRKIQSFGDLLVSEYSDAIPQEGRDFLARMQKAASRMRVLIDSLLAYSRVNTRFNPISKVDLNKAVREAMNNLSVRREETNASVEVAELPTIEGDLVQMVQLFQNLIGNALKFHAKGTSPKVRVHARSWPDDGSDTADAVEICVADEGIGFDETYLSKIFNPFQRLHGRSAYEGVGIGLAICRRIVERHHGRITAEGNPGKGAVFTVTLPKRQERKAV
jgi:PAS domain S-box-containing protein